MAQNVYINEQVRDSEKIEMEDVEIDLDKADLPDLDDDLEIGEFPYAWTGGELESVSAFNGETIAIITDNLSRTKVVVMTRIRNQGVIMMKTEEATKRPAKEVVEEVTGVTKRAAKVAKTMEKIWQ